ncbi:MAG: hypothetical protein K1000chlam2_01440 [Chlamydiae bacterium]|nr:hypothetical protein [Chlamydiota bacterium]
MRNGNLLFSAVQFLIITALFGGGAVFFGLHFSPDVRLQLSEWISKSNGNFFFLGCLLSGIAALLTVCFYMMQKGRYLRIQMGKPFSIDEAVVKKTVKEFWKEEFPEEDLPTDIYVAKQKIEVITKDSDVDLEEIEKRLSKHLSEQFGYERKFFLTLTQR